MNALFANLIWATPDLFQSESVFETRVEKFFAERVSTIDLLTDDVQLAPAFEQEIQTVTSRREASIFAEERFVEAAGIHTPAPVANDFAPEVDFIGQNRALQDNDFDAFLATLAPEKLDQAGGQNLSETPEDAYDSFQPCLLSEEDDATTQVEAPTIELPVYDTVWLIDKFTGLQVATLNDLG